MLTLFTIPKSFCGHIGVIQRNAIQSWTLLRPACEIILFGDEEGVPEVADGFGIKHIPEVTRNEFGTPLLGLVFKMVQDISSYHLVAYVNADIILMSDFLEAIKLIQQNSFLMVGQRWDIDLNDVLEFDDPDWEFYLKATVKKKGNFHDPAGTDYFVFPKGLFREIPPFAIGRPAWDNWFISRAYLLGIKVIDSSIMMMAVHQNHDYSHVPDGIADTWEGPEAEYNRKLAGCAVENFFTINNATHILTPNGLLESPIHLAQKGNFKEAEKNLNEILILATENAKKCDILLSLASIYVQQGRFKEAETKINESLLLEPKDKNLIISVYYILGSNYERIGRLEKAKEKFREVIRLVKESGFSLDKNRYVGGAHYHLGVIYQRVGEVDKARDEFEECIRLIPDHRKAKEGLRKIRGL